jgi:hypothetical protein
MAGIGADIAEVIAELGVTATILRTPKNLTEKVTYEVNEQATRPVVREHFLNASFAYNSVVVPGDIIQFGGNSFLVANMTPDSFEGETVEYVSLIFKCNFPPSTVFLSPANTQDPNTFAITNGWAIRKANPYGFVYQGDFVVTKNTEVDTGKDVTFKLQCCVPISYGIKAMDRIYLSASEYYRIQDVDDYTYPGVSVMTLVEDDRVVYIP